MSAEANQLDVPGQAAAVAADFPELHNDTILRAARGEPVQHTPIWIHRQAGRYLPEFRAVRKENEFFKLCRTPDLACEVTLQPIRRFPLDAAIIFSDILVIPQALGLEVRMEPGVGPVFPEPLAGVADLGRLQTDIKKVVHEELSYVYAAITETRHKLEGKVPLLGFSGAPWTLMAYMIHGRGAKSWDKARSWLVYHPEESHTLLKLLTDCVIEYLVLQVQAGAQMLEVFDSWLGDLPPKLMKEFMIPCLARIATEVKSELKKRNLPQVPMTIFPKGLTLMLRDIAELDYDCISVDWTLTPQEARELCGNKTVQGNLDPAVLPFVDPADPEKPINEEVIRQGVREMLDGFGPSKYIVNLGHGMLPFHDPRGVAVFVDEVHVHSAKLLQQQQQQQQ